MATTGTAVLNQVNAVLPQNAIFSSVEKLAAINAAIIGGWPKIANEATDSSVTLASATYEYTPTATPETEYGFSYGYVTLTSNPKVLLRRLSQRRNGTAWVIIVPPDITSGLSGETLHLQYYTTFSTITALTDTINMPLDYLWKYAAYILCLTGIAKVGDFDRSAYEKLAPQYERMAESARMAHETHKTQMIRRVSEQGTSNTNRSDRYGPYLTS